MALEGPQLHYGRVDVIEEDPVVRALRLAREVEDLLEQTPSIAPAVENERAQAIRMARAMAASLVDELESITRGSRKTSAYPRTA